MTRTPTTLQPFTNLLLAELRRLDLLDKNKEVARRCNEALGKAGYILGPQLYRVGGAVPEDGWSSEGKKRAIAVTSRTVTRWKQGVIPVGAHLEAVIVSLFSEGANEASDEALTSQEAFQMMRRFGVGEEEIQRVGDVRALWMYDNDVIFARGKPLRNLIRAVFNELLSYELNLSVDLLPATPARAARVIEDVEAEYARAGKTPPEKLSEWIRRLMAAEWCREHAAHVEVFYDRHLFFTTELADFMKERL